MLVTSTLYRRRQLRVKTRNRTIWARHWISNREEYGAYNVYNGHWYNSRSDAGLNTVRVRVRVGAGISYV